MNHPDIFISSRTTLEEKLSRFSRENLRVIADFDGTMTHPSPSSWGLLDQLEPHMPGYHLAAREIYQKYRPYETDMTLSEEVKDRYMQEWWDHAADIFRQFGIKIQYLENIDVEKIMLREGIYDAFDYFKSNHIPVLILSAGIYQTIEMILSHYGIVGEHLSLTANELVFDTEGNYAGTTPERHIHAGNKDSLHITDEVASRFQGRNQIILLGDNLHDIRMIDPHERDNTLAIGYCSDKGQMNAYCDTFDIVVNSPTSDLGVLRSLLDTISLQ